MSNKKVGSVINLFISSDGASHRTTKDKLILDELGVKEDKFYNKNAERSVLISSIQSYLLVKEKNIDIPHGYLGENILMDFNPYSLDIGTQLKIGDTILEITQNCTICNHLAVIDNSIPELLKNDRGIFAKVTQNGNIKVNDGVYIYEQSNS